MIGSDSTELEIITTTNVLQGYPDNDGVDDEDTQERIFKIDQTY